MLVNAKRKLERSINICKKLNVLCYEGKEVISALWTVVASQGTEKEKSRKQ